VKTGENQYQTRQKSRVVAIGATSDKIENAATKIDEAIARHVTGELEYRKDIGSKQYLEKLSRISEKLQEEAV
ncbi:MAG: hypothetical protein ACKO2V_11525, partial [Snowella sp.]